MTRLEATAELIRMLCEKTRHQPIGVSIINGVIRPWVYKNNKASVSEYRVEPMSGESIGTIITTRPPMIYEDIPDERR